MGCALAPRCMSGPLPEIAGTGEYAILAPAESVPADGIYRIAALRLRRCRMLAAGSAPDDTVGCKAGDPAFDD
jgi:hypothetical protein